MARIPLALARPALETGAAVRYPQGGGPAGAAVEGLGAGIAGLAAHVEATGRRREAFDAALREQEFLDEMERLEGEAAGRAPPDGEGLHDAVYAAGKGQGASLFDEVFGRHAALVPEAQRAAFEAGREHWRQAGSRRLAALQLERRRQHEAGAFARIRERLLAAVRGAAPAEPSAFEAARRQGLDVVSAMTVPEASRAALAAAWENDVTLAALEARLRQDPGFAARARNLLGTESSE